FMRFNTIYKPTRTTGKPMLKLRASAALAALLATLPVPRAAAPADLILYNAKIWTVDPRQPTAEALAIRGDRIVQVGSNRDMLAFRNRHTRLLDLHGQF